MNDDDPSVAEEAATAAREAIEAELARVERMVTIATVTAVAIAGVGAYLWWQSASAGVQAAKRFTR